MERWTSDDGSAVVYNDDCRKVKLRVLADCIVTDPPYGLKFMGRGWDQGVPDSATWKNLLQKVKPGAHLLAFGGTRTYHRLAVAIEDAGWELRDCIMWVYGSGFPKSLDVSKAIDSEAGAKREVIRTPMTKHSTAGKGLSNELDESPWMTEAREKGYHDHARPQPVTPAAKQWQGWGTALKPAWEPIIVARKPLVGTVARNVQQYGPGGINVDGCRVGTEKVQSGNGSLGKNKIYGTMNRDKSTAGTVAGRWPANFIHDGSEEVTALFPTTKGVGHHPKHRGKGGLSTSGHAGQKDLDERHGDTGTAARFFYCAKASNKDRDEGLADQPDRVLAMSNQAKADQKRGNSRSGSQLGVNDVKVRKNAHPTVKPTDLMRYLCRLVTPPDGIVLDPFMGSGSTGKAAILEGFQFIGIDNDTEHDYCKTAIARIKHAFKTKR